MAARIADRARYRQRIKALLAREVGVGGGFAAEIEVQAHWAKYNCVLISGYLEQAIKEILLGHVSASSPRRVVRYVETGWPSSKNMSVEAITKILNQFDQRWGERFEAWTRESERKKEVNEIIKWRNDIAHGNEANTNNVTKASVAQKFKVACDLVDFVESLPAE